MPNAKPQARKATVPMRSSAGCGRHEVLLPYFGSSPGIEHLLPAGCRASPVSSSAVRSSSEIWPVSGTERCTSCRRTSATVRASATTPPRATAPAMRTRRPTRSTTISSLCTSASPCSMPSTISKTASPAPFPCLCRLLLFLIRSQPGPTLHAPRVGQQCRHQPIHSGIGDNASTNHHCRSRLYARSRPENPPNRISGNSVRLRSNPALTPWRCCSCFGQHGNQRLPSLPSQSRLSLGEAPGVPSGPH